MHSTVTSKNESWPRLIWPTLYKRNNLLQTIRFFCQRTIRLYGATGTGVRRVIVSDSRRTQRRVFTLFGRCLMALQFQHSCDISCPRSLRITWCSSQICYMHGHRPAQARIRATLACGHCHDAFNQPVGSDPASILGPHTSSLLLPDCISLARLGIHYMHLLLLLLLLHEVIGFTNSFPAGNWLTSACRWRQPCCVPMKITTRKLIVRWLQPSVNYTSASTSTARKLVRTGGNFSDLSVLSWREFFRRSRNHAPTSLEWLNQFNQYI